MLGFNALARFAQLASGVVLDVGSGNGEQARYLREQGIEVRTLDNKSDADYCGDFNTIDVGVYDGIHCCHVLEHQRNSGLFLDKINQSLKEGGWLCITVPPLKHSIVGGHVSLWNAGLLVYHLVLAGFDCSEAWVETYGYNVSVVTQKRSIDLPAIKMANGDIEILSRYFPWDVCQGFNGNQESQSRTVRFA